MVAAAKTLSVFFMGLLIRTLSNTFLFRKANHKNCTVIINLKKHFVLE